MHDIARRAIEGDEPIADLVAEFYGPDGPLAEAGWEVRSQQARMSSDIADAIDAWEAEERRLWVQHEAPTGTGKGLAYLVPGVLAALRARRTHEAEVRSAKEKGLPVPSRPKCLISTANIALQDQLVTKDVPAIAAMLGIEISAAVAKSRQNYVCLRKTTAAGLDARATEAIAGLDAWLSSGGDGDRESVPWDTSETWHLVSSTSDRCTGHSCPFYDDPANLCYWRRAARKVKDADVVVYNHHFLAAKPSDRTVLLAVDEAHELESALRASLEGHVTHRSGESAASAVDKWVDGAEALIADPVRELLDAAVADWMEHQPTDRYGNPLPGRTSPLVLKPGWYKYPERIEGLRTAWDELGDACRSLGCFLMSERRWKGPRASHDNAKIGAAAAGAANRLWALYERCYAVARGEPYPTWPGESWALFVDVDKRGNAKASTVPADVAPAAERLRAGYPVAVLTSATMPADQTLRLTMGIPDTGADTGSLPGMAPTVRLPSPYDLESQGLLVVPSGPSPKDRSWPGEHGWAATEVADAVGLAGGGALVLASSVRQMKAYGVMLRDTLPPALAALVRVQGEEGRGTLRSWFRDEHDGILVATRSFFQGLDVQGDSLRLVIIDRIPFSRPDDPVESAIGELLIERNDGGNSFLLRSVPGAAMLLAQAAGRLIRSPTDRGVVMLLDNRILGRGEAWSLLRDALPPFPMARSTASVGAFLRGDEVTDLIGSPTQQRAVSARRRRF